MENAMDRMDDFFERWGKIKEKAEVRSAVNILVSHGVTPEQYEKIYESGIFNGESHD